MLFRNKTACGHWHEIDNYTDVHFYVENKWLCNAGLEDACQKKPIKSTQGKTENHKEKILDKKGEDKVDKTKSDQDESSNGDGLKNGTEKIIDLATTTSYAGTILYK